jgi:hypothetical protein
MYKVKQSLYSPWQAVRVPGVWGSQILRQSAHEGGKVVSPMHRSPLPPWNIPGTQFCQRLSQPQSNSAAGRAMSMKNSNDTIGNQSRDLLVCSSASTTAPPRAPINWIYQSLLMNTVRISGLLHTKPCVSLGRTVSHTQLTTLNSNFLLTLCSRATTKVVFSVTRFDPRSRLSFSHALFCECVCRQV